MGEISETEYRSKKEEVLSKFKKEFVEEYYNYDPWFRSIAESLIRGEDPYSIIEMLLVNRKKMVNQHSQLFERYPNPQNFTLNVDESIANGVINDFRSAEAKIFKEVLTQYFGREPEDSDSYRIVRRSSGFGNRNYSIIVDGSHIGDMKFKFPEYPDHKASITFVPTERYKL